MLPTLAMFLYLFHFPFTWQAPGSLCGWFWSQLPGYYISDSHTGNSLRKALHWWVKGPLWTLISQHRESRAPLRAPVTRQGCPTTTTELARTSLALRIHDWLWHWVEDDQKSFKSQSPRETPLSFVFSSPVFSGLPPTKIVTVNTVLLLAPHTLNGGGGEAESKFFTHTHRYRCILIKRFLFYIIVNPKSINHWIPLIT